MNTITVVGLGPGSKKYLTIDAYEKIIASEVSYLRTEKHPVVDYLKEKGAKFESYDWVYDEADKFDEVYEKIVFDLLEKVKLKNITYCIPGNPFVAERTVELLKEKIEDEKINIEYIYGASFIDAVITALKRDPVYGLRIHDSLMLENFVPLVNVDNLFIQVYDNRIASDLKIALSKYYDDDYKIIIVRGAGIEGEEIIEEIKLFELDRIGYLDYLTSIYVPRNMGNKKYDFFDFLNIMEKLRSSDGCVWDKAQTHETLSQYLIEEAYETVEAINEYDIDGMIEELGDVFLQIVFHAQIGSEDGYFDIYDIIDGICKKLINRHPHVFSDIVVNSKEDVQTNWNIIKAKEKKLNKHSEGMKKIPVDLPNLLKAEKIQKIAASLGFDWDDVSGAIEKVKEEFFEVKEVLYLEDHKFLEEELGDLLFSVVNVCRMKNISPEIALSLTNKKFIDRFNFIETELKKNGDEIEKKSLSDLDKLWEKSKIQRKMEKKG